MENLLNEYAAPRLTSEAQKEQALDAIRDEAKAVLQKFEMPWQLQGAIETIFVLATHKCDIDDLPKKNEAN